MILRESRDAGNLESAGQHMNSEARAGGDALTRPCEIVAYVPADNAQCTPSDWEYTRKCGNWHARLANGPSQMTGTMSCAGCFCNYPKATNLDNKEWIGSSEN
jgi:hypothetical protein